MKNTSMRARRTTGTSTDSPTAANGLRRRAATVPRTREDRFVVGYRSRGNVVFGKDTRGNTWAGFIDAAQPMTLRQAVLYLRDEMPASGACLFELVPVRSAKSS